MGNAVPTKPEELGPDATPLATGTSTTLQPLAGAPPRLGTGGSSKIIPEQVDVMFQPPEKLSSIDEELLRGLNYHHCAYLVLGYENSEVIFVSTGFEHKVGTPSAQAVGKAATTLIKEIMEIPEQETEKISRALADKVDVVLPVHGKKGTNPEVYCLMYFTSMKTEAGALSYLLCVLEMANKSTVSDLSRNMGFRLRTANACMRPGDGTWTLFEPYKELCEVDKVLVDTLIDRKDMFCITDPALYDNPIVYVSDDFIDMTGYSRHEINGINCRFLQGHDTSPEDVAVIRNAIKEQKHARICLLNYRKNGTRFINQFNLSPLRDRDGNIAYFIGVQADVEDAEIVPFPNSRQTMAEMLVEGAERNELSLSFTEVAV